MKCHLPSYLTPWLKDESKEERQQRVWNFPSHVIVNPWLAPGGTTTWHLFYSNFWVNRSDVYRWPEPAVLHQLTGDDLRSFVLGFFDEEWYAEYDRKREPFIPTSTAATTSIISGGDVVTYCDSNISFATYYVG